MRLIGQVYVGPRGTVNPTAVEHGGPDPVSPRIGATVLRHGEAAWWLPGERTGGSPGRCRGGARDTIARDRSPRMPPRQALRCR